LSVGSLIVDSKNDAGFITRRLAVRSMFETTNTVMRHQVIERRYSFSYI